MLFLSFRDTGYEHSSYKHVLVPKAAEESNPGHKYPCSHSGCSYAARSLDHLKEHTNTHTKANVMRCPICIKEKKPGNKQNHFSKESNSTHHCKLKHPEVSFCKWTREASIRAPHFQASPSLIVELTSYVSASISKGFHPA